MKITDKSYIEHQIFSDLDYYIKFYGDFSESIFFWTTRGTKALANIDSCIYSSMQGTLESIKHTLQNGRIGDAYALLRRYYDASITNIYINLYIEQNISLEKWIIDKINNWILGKESIIRFEKIAEYIEDAPIMKPIKDLINVDERYKEIRYRCNDFNHYNFFQNFIANDNQFHQQNRLKLLNNFTEDMRNIFILHVGYIFYLNDNYMMASDYIDSLDIGVEPEENSQYWVAPFIQEAFDKIISNARPDIKDLIKAHTSMHLI